MRRCRSGARRRRSRRRGRLQPAVLSAVSGAERPRSAEQVRRSRLPGHRRQIPCRADAAAAGAGREGAGRDRQRLLPPSHGLEADDQGLAQPTRSQQVSGLRLSHRRATATLRPRSPPTQCDRFVQGPLPGDRWREEILADRPHILIYPEIGMDPGVGLARRAPAGAGPVRFLGPPEYDRLPDDRLFPVERPDGAARRRAALHRASRPPAQSLDLLRAARPGAGHGSAASSSACARRPSPIGAASRCSNTCRNTTRFLRASRARLATASLLSSNRIMATR